VRRPTSRTIRGVGHALFDRDAELAELAALLERARKGDGGTLLFEGPGGIGKTALLAAGEELASGFAVLRGRGGEVERELSFGLVRELFDPLLRAAPQASRERWLSGAASAGGAVFQDARAGVADAASVTYGLYWLLAAVAEERPVLLIADDLHWCDPSSLRWLTYLARRIDGLPVAFLGASRPAEANEPGAAGQLAAIAGVAVRRPESLSLESTRELIARGSIATPAEAFVRACHTATGGNPWLLQELLGSVRDAGLTLDEHSVGRIDDLTGDRLRPAVLARLARIEAPAGHLARAVAVLGDGCELRHAAGLARMTADAAVAILPALIAAGVLGDSPSLTFAHPLLRAAVYLDIPAPVRVAEHGRAAAVLHAANAPVEAVAHHLLAAEPVGEEWALVALSEAGRTALARGAPDSAVPYLRRALRERPDAPQRTQLLRSLGNAMLRQGDSAAIGVLEEALELATSPAARVEIVAASADPLLASGRAADARSLLTAALADAEATGAEPVTLFSAHLVMIRALDGSRGGEEHTARLCSSLAHAEASTTAQRYAAGVLALLGAVCDGTAAASVELARRALASEASADEDARAGRPLHMARVALALAGEPAEALLGMARALDVSQARGSLMGQGIGLGWRALINLVVGNVGDVENDARASIAVLSESGLSGPELGACAALAWALIERGELAEAGDVLAAAPPPHGWGGAGIGCARAQLLIARHRHAEALAELAAVEQQAVAAGWRSAAPLAWRSLAAVAQLASGHADLARQLAVDEVAEAERFGCARELGRALRVLGLMDGRDAQLAAIECLRGSGATLELARALVDRGAALRRAGERASAREPLHEGLELATASGATALAERARIELRAAGARPRRVARSGVDSLTPSERRVATLAAEGLTNAEVAQTLFVTVRTVEMHLSAAYRKLEIPSRAALPAALSA
jgi:DNA-binding CsgD family transcriptional regulator